MIQWVKDKLGRITTIIGGFLMTVDILPIDPIKQPLADFIGDVWARRLVSGTALACFLISWLRHQKAARKINCLEQQQKPPQ